MRNIHFTVSRAVNGYTINEYDGDVPFTMEALDACHVAMTQDEVAKVVKQIIRGAFGTDEKPAKRKKLVDGEPTQFPEARELKTNSRPGKVKLPVADAIDAKLKKEKADES